LNARPGTVIGARSSAPLVDLASERAYLGAIVSDASTMRQHPIPLADFGSRQHQTLLGAMIAIEARGEPIDTLSIRAELVASGRLEHAGGDDVLLAITSQIVVAEQAGALARSIRKMARLRAMRAASLEALAAIENLDEDAAREAFTVTPGDGVEDEILTFRELMARGLEEAVLSRGSDAELGGMRFGTPTFDKGYRPSPGHVVIVGGRANVGKTSLTFAWHLSCAERGIPSAIVSLDDSPADYGVKGVGAVSHFNPRRIWNDRLTSQDIELLVRKAQEKADLPIFFVRVRSRHIADIEGVVDRLVRKHGIKWFSLDYLTKVRAPGRDLRERTNEALSRIDMCAKRYDVTAVVLAQLKRLGDGKSAKSAFREPTLEDFKESGDIEEYASAAVLLWKESDKKGAPTRAKNAKMKRDDAGERFTLIRDPDSGLLVEQEGLLAPPGSYEDGDDDWG
jgi:replicative DNA helicase